MIPIGRGALCAMVGALVVSVVPVADAQDLFAEMQKVKQDIEELKRQVNELRGLLYSLTKSGPGEPGRPGAQRSQQPVAPQSKVPEFAEIKPAVCLAVENYLSAVDSNLRLRDANVVQANVSRALSELQKVLSQYSSNPQVSRLQEMADELNWDAYSDVALRGSPDENRAFNEDIARHRKAMNAYCEPR